MEKKASSLRRSTSKRRLVSSPTVSRRIAIAPRPSVATRICVGVSGWLYPPWRGSFYPAKLPQRRELEYAASKFNSIEINGSFYSLQRRESWQRWYHETPSGFVFAVKGSRYMTHMLRLRDPEQPLANFLSQGVLALNEKLGPILWQLPPQMSFEPERMREFLAVLPRDTGAALAVARGRDARMDGRDYLEIDQVRPMRHAFEVRHASFLDERFIAMLREYNAAFVIAETAKRWPMVFEITADFVYLRLHGDKTMYQSGYAPKALERWAGRIREWSAERDVFCYFDNTDVKLRAPRDAQTLMRILGLLH